MTSQNGFTLLELLIVIAIIGLLSSVVLSSMSGTRDQAYLARAQSEAESFHSAVLLYRQDNNEYPPDEDRSIPSEMESYLGNEAWPDGPWPGSVYDWDNWEIDGERVMQLSIRFCEYDNPSSCQFPDADWAEDFKVNSAVYYCIEGECRPHEEEPADYPGYCLNC